MNAGRATSRGPDAPQPRLVECEGVIGGTQTGTEVGVSSGNFIYGRFSFTIDGLTPGDYELRWPGVPGPPEGPEFLQTEPFTVIGP